jgi:hypothetical protein
MLSAAEAPNFLPLPLPQQLLDLIQFHQRLHRRQRFDIGIQNIIFELFGEGNY